MKWSLICICLLLIFNFCFSRTLEFSAKNGYVISNYVQSDNYLLVKTKSKNDYELTVYKDSQATINLTASRKSSFAYYYLLEKLNMLVVITWGKEANIIEKTATTKNIIKSIDLKSGNTIWETTSTAGHYTLSPDSTKLLTTMHDFSERTFEPAVINLHNGQKYLIDKNKYNQIFCWYNNDLVFCIANIYVNNPDYNYEEQMLEQEIIQKEKEEREIRRALHKAPNNNDLKKELEQITEQKYKLIEEKKSLWIKDENTGRVYNKSRMAAPREFFSKTAIKKFNFIDNLLVEEIELVNNQGERVKFQSFFLNHGGIQRIDNAFNIPISNFTQDKFKIAQFDMNFKVIKEVIIPKLAPCYKLNLLNTIYYWTKWNGKDHLINSNSLIVDEAKPIEYLELKNIHFPQRGKSENTINIYKNIKCEGNLLLQQD